MVRGPPLVLFPFSMFPSAFPSFTASQLRALPFLFLPPFLSLFPSPGPPSPAAPGLAVSPLAPRRVASLEEGSCPRAPTQPASRAGAAAAVRVGHPHLPALGIPPSARLRALHWTRPRPPTATPAPAPFLRDVPVPQMRRTAVKQQILHNIYADMHDGISLSFS